MAGQKIIITPVNGTNGLEQMSRQINGNLSKIQNKLNQKSTSIILYDSGHSLAKVFIGKTENGEDVIAIARDGVDVIKALSNSPVSENDFVFNSKILVEKVKKINDEIESIKNKITELELKNDSQDREIIELWRAIAPPPEENDGEITIINGTGGE